MAAKIVVGVFSGVSGGVDGLYLALLIEGSWQFVAYSLPIGTVTSPLPMGGGTSGSQSATGGGTSGVGT